MRERGVGSFSQINTAAKKGQAEFIVIVGIIVVIAIVAYFALSTNVFYQTPVPAAVAEEKKLVEDAVTNVGRQGADIAIKWIEQQGGYLTPDLNNAVAFTNVAVPYWQRCEQTSVPTLNEINNQLEDAVKNYIMNDLANRKEYFSRNVSFDFSSMYVSANILNNKIDFSVYLPTTIRDYDIPQPYTFSVPTKLREIHEFGKGFAQENANKRYLEHFTINTIYFSGDLETQGVLNDCGEGIYQSGPDITQGLENIITYTLTNMIWWQPMPTDNSISKVYSIESLNGKTYEGLEIGLYTPDGFELGPAAPIHMTNAGHAATASIGPVPVFDIPVCFALYNFLYSVDYPVVVRVKDDLTGHYMNFAVHVDVNNMLPADCSAYISLPDGSEGSGCDARVKVMGTGGPLKGATVSFAEAYVGKTGANGVVTGTIPCDSGKLIVNKPGYGFLELDKSYADINGTYTLYKKPVIDINFRQVDITSRYRNVFVGPTQIQMPLYEVCYINPTNNQVVLNFTSSSGYYGATNIDPDSSNSDCLDSPECEACRNDTEDIASCQACISSCSIGVLPSTSIDYMPGGSYTVKADMWNFGLSSPVGAFSTTYNIPEQDRTFYVYVPTRSMMFITENDRTSLTNELNNKCGIDNPVDTKEYTGVVNMVIGCSCGELGSMTSNEFSSCIDTTEYSTLFTGGCNINAIKNMVQNECGYEVIGCG